MTIEIDLHGGLGDGLIKIHESMGYEQLEALKPGERASVRIVSHNPFVRELFLWHPRAEQIDVAVARFFFLDFGNPVLRRSAGIPEAPARPCSPRERAPVRFYPSPEDLAVLDSDLPREPFLAIAPTSSGMEIENRDIPAEVLDSAVAQAAHTGVPVVLLGRTYKGPHLAKSRNPRPEGLGIVDLTDRLSVPGTAVAIKRARAVLSAHSCLLLLAWYERKPVFALYPPKYEWHDFLHPSPFGFGKDYPETTRMLFSEYTHRAFKEFLGRHFRVEA